MFKNQTFGAASTGFGSFNASASTASPFSGFKPTASTSAFGAPPAFGANATPQATTGGGLFGSTNTTGGLFGNTNTPSSFGQSSGFGFGANTSGGGLFSNNAGTGLFAGNQNTSSFGAKPSGFGFGSTTTTGTTGGLFGSAPSTSTGLFGQQNNTLGGTGLFGNTTGGFGQQAASGTAHVKYNPVVGTDVVVKSGTSQNVNIKHHCITCMKEYESKSLEELRLEDYAAGRKGAQGGMFGGFQQTENKPLFGGSTFGQPATTSAPSLFGGGIGSTSGFGQTSQYPCQNMRKHACMPAHPCTHPCIPQCRFNLNCNAPTFCSAHACMLAGNVHVCTCPCRSKSVDTEKCLTSGTKFHTCMLPHQMFSNNFCNGTDRFNEGILSLVHNSLLGAKMSLELTNSTFDATLKAFNNFSGKILYAQEYMVLRVLFDNSRKALDHAKKSFAMASKAYDFSICQRSNGTARSGVASFMFINANRTLNDVDVYIKNFSNEFQCRLFYHVPTLASMRTAFNSVVSALNNAKNALEMAIRDLGVDKMFPLDFTANSRNKYTFGVPSNSYVLNNSSAGFTYFGTGANSHGPKFPTHGTVSGSPLSSYNSFGAAFNSSGGEVKSSNSALDSTNIKLNAFGTAFDSANAEFHSLGTAFNSSDSAFGSTNTKSNAFGTAFDSANAEFHSVGTAFNSSNAGTKDDSSSKNWFNWFNSADTGFKSTSFNLSARSDQKFSDTAVKFGNTDKKASDSAMSFCDNKESTNSGIQFGGTGMKFSDTDKKCIDTDMKLCNAARKPSDTGMNFGDNDLKTKDMKFGDTLKNSNGNGRQFSGFMNFGDADKISNYNVMKFGNTNKQSSNTSIKFGGTGMKFCDTDKKYIDTDMELCNAAKKPSDTDMNFDGSTKKTSNMKFGETNKISSNTSMKFGITNKQSSDSGMHFGVPDKKCIDTSFKFGIGELKNTSPIDAPKSDETGKDFDISGLANISSQFVNAGASSTDKTELINNFTGTNTTGPVIDIVLLTLKDTLIEISDTDIKLDDINKKFRDTDVKFARGIDIKFGSSGVTNTSSKNDNAGAGSGNNEFSADESKIDKDDFKSDVTSTKFEKDGPTPEDDSLGFEKGSKSEVTDPKLNGTDIKDSKFENNISDSNVLSQILADINNRPDSVRSAKVLIIDHGKIVYKKTVVLLPNHEIDKNGTHSKDTNFEIDKGEPNSQNDSLEIEKGDLTSGDKSLEINRNGTGSNDSSSLKIDKGGPNSGEDIRVIGKDGRTPDGEYLKNDRPGTGSHDCSLEMDKGCSNSGEDSRNIENYCTSSGDECLEININGTGSNDSSSLKIDKGGPNSGEDIRNIGENGRTPDDEYLKNDRPGTGSHDCSLEMDKGCSNSGEDSRNIENYCTPSGDECLKIDKDGASSNVSLKTDEIDSNNLKESLTAKDDTEFGGKGLEIDNDGTGSDVGSF